MKTVDEPFAEFEIGRHSGSNSEHEDDGNFRRFIHTHGGIELILPGNYPFEWIGFLADQADNVAEANFEAGKRQAKAELRAALGLADEDIRRAAR